MPKYERSEAETTLNAMPQRGALSQQFWAKVAEKQAAGYPRDAAVSATVHAHPDLHRGLLIEHNVSRGRPAPTFADS